MVAPGRSDFDTHLLDHGDIDFLCYFLCYFLHSPPAQPEQRRLLNIVDSFT
mgnify:CR=1 FL=1